MAVKGAIIAIDFDGTVVTHAYPHMGMDAGAVPVLKELVANDCKLILYTMRSGQLLEKAVQWFKEQKIPLYAINENPGQKSWTSSPKVHADLYIDDSALGCPIRFMDGGSRLGENPPTTGRSRLPGLSPGISPVPESRIPPNRSRRTGGREPKPRFREADRWLVTTTSGLSGASGIESERRTE